MKAHNIYKKTVKIIFSKKILKKMKLLKTLKLFKAQCRNICKAQKIKISYFK